MEDKTIINPREFELCNPNLNIQGATKRQAISVQDACMRPEIRSLTGSVSFSVDQSLHIPIAVGKNSVCFHPSTLDKKYLTTFFTRYALEIAIWLGVEIKNQSPTTPYVIALSCCRVAGRYLQTMNNDEKSQFKEKTFDWFMKAIDFTSQPALDPIALGNERAMLKKLLKIQGCNERFNDDLTFLDKVCDETNAITPVTSPLEVMMTMGGDARLCLDPETGLNAYGCCPRPRPWAITFSSSTASSISDLAFHAAEKIRQNLIAKALQGKLLNTFDDAFKTVRTQIAEIFDLDQVPGTKVAITNSGTDAELYILHFARTKDQKSLTNILIAPEEVGKGSIHAAAARHFSSEVVSGETVSVGTPIAGTEHWDISVKYVALRDSLGKLHEKQVTDAEIVDLVETAISDGRRVLLHVLDCSKTGIGGPSLEMVLQLKDRHPDSLDIVVDACQLRLTKENLHSYLKHGFMILVTGSKFVTGPPFSGMLLIPAKISKRIATLPAFPIGFQAYSARPEWPKKMSNLSAPLAPSFNIGLLMRWHAALREMTFFKAVPNNKKIEILTAFRDAVLNTIEQQPHFDQIQTHVFDRSPLGNTQSWDGLQTIFTFLVRHHGSTIPLTMNEARKVYELVNQDITHLLPPDASEADRKLAAHKGHIGQPVKVIKHKDDWFAALRISGGARLVYGVLFDKELGATEKERLDFEINCSLIVIKKIAMVIDKILDPPSP